MKKLLAFALAAVMFCAPAMAVNAPDTTVVTGPNFQQVPSSQMVVTPNGGSQTTLGAALAAGGGGITIPNAPLLAGNGSTLQPVTAINGVSFGQATPAAVGATAITATAGVVDTTTPAASTFGINTTAALKFGGTIGAIGSNGSILDNETTYTENASGAVRARFLLDTITNNGSTSGFDEGMFLQRLLQGTGTYTSEVNGYHSYLQAVAGVTVTAANFENFEASLLNNGTVTHQASYISVPENGATGTVSDFKGFTTALKNDNTTAGSIGQWAAFSTGPCACSSPPTHFFAFDNTDPLQGIITAGNVVIGHQGDAAAAIMLAITSNVPSGGSTTTTLPILVTGSGQNGGATGNIFFVHDNGTGFLAGALSTGGLTLTNLTGSTQCLEVGSAGNVIGTGSTCGSGGGGGVTSVSNSDGTITVATGTTTPVVSINLANANTWTGNQYIQGPDNSSSAPFRVTNLAGAFLESIGDNGNVTFSGNLSVGSNGVLAGDQSGAITIINAATPTAGTAKIYVPAGNVSQSLVGINTTVSVDTFATLGMTQTFAGTNTFSTILHGTASTILSNSTVPTVASGFGTSPTIPAGTSTAWFEVNVGTGGTALSGVLTFPAATHNWVCNVAESTANIGSIVTRAAPTSTTSVTLTSYSATTGTPTPWSASDVLSVACTGG